MSRKRGSGRGLCCGAALFGAMLHAEFDGRRGIMAKSSDGSGTVIIKKYANRRLYNTETSSYITLDHLAAMTREGRDFKVIDAKTEDDITHNVLTQIIM